MNQDAGQKSGRMLRTFSYWDRATLGICAKPFSFCFGDESADTVHLGGGSTLYAICGWHSSDKWDTGQS